MKPAAKALVEIIHGQGRDAKERVQALRLQAEAWRLLALIAMERPQYARLKARTMFFVSVPFVDKQWMQQFIEEHRDMAKACGLAAGVFDR